MPGRRLAEISRRADERLRPLRKTTKAIVDAVETAEIRWLWRLAVARVHSPTEQVCGGGPRAA